MYASLLAIFLFAGILFSLSTPSSANAQFCFCTCGDTTIGCTETQAQCDSQCNPGETGVCSNVTQETCDLAPERGIGVSTQPTTSTAPRAPSTTSTRLFNPLGGTTSIPALIGNVISALLTIAGALALLMFIWGGLQMVISQGDPGKITKGKDTLKYAVIGLVIIFSAYAMVDAVINAITRGSI